MIAFANISVGDREQTDTGSDGFITGVTASSQDAIHMTHNIQYIHSSYICHFLSHLCFCGEEFFMPKKKTVIE